MCYRVGPHLHTESFVLACLLYLMLVTAMHGLQQQLGVHLTWQSANMHQVPT